MDLGKMLGVNVAEVEKRALEATVRQEEMVFLLRGIKDELKVAIELLREINQRQAKS